MTNENSMLTSAFGSLKWHDDPTPKQVEAAFRNGTPRWGNFQVVRVVKEGERFIQNVDMIITPDFDYDLEFPGSKVTGPESCFIYKSSHGETRKTGGLLVWSPEIELNEEIIIEDPVGVEVKLWECNRAPMSVGIDLVNRLFSDGYEGDDLLWATMERSRTLNFDKSKMPG